MARTHLTRRGQWANCIDMHCTLPIHVSLTLAEVANLPGTFIEQLAEAFDPPSVVEENRRLWHDSRGRLHRDYDLPAIIANDGGRSWYRHGKRHRDGDQPAWLQADGTKAWLKHGTITRRFGHPAVIEADGSTWSSASTVIMDTVRAWLQRIR